MPINVQEAYASILLFLLRQLLISPAYIHVITDGDTDHGKNYYIRCTDGHKYSIQHFREKDKAILTTENRVHGTPQYIMMIVLVAGLLMNYRNDPKGFLTIRNGMTLVFIILPLLAWIFDPANHVPPWEVDTGIGCRLSGCGR